ncbi:hypothetical protein BDP81DRAFT_442255 [Colletotrichum phormii]|uniref:Uncharacterized protein n=1 Tax=Colletotrichum phormii TaxID=359342 RepID=A0AAI9ZEJ9_9PEZI|nr:uncharacterized protein BDP81DRAFT_442255 [Colletotrichum phormii]KAK1622120.1 hypothetical protein BDP81DRAFT_442255 [Colletotrichum phormii]
MPCSTLNIHGDKNFRDTMLLTSRALDLNVSGTVVTSSYIEGLSELAYFHHMTKELSNWNLSPGLMARV